MGAAGNKKNKPKAKHEASYLKDEPTEAVKHNQKKGSK